MAGPAPTTQETAVHALHSLRLLATPEWTTDMHLGARYLWSCPSLLCSAEHGVPGEAIAEAYDAFEKGTVVSPLAAAAVSNQTIQESMKLVLLVRAFQVCLRWQLQNKLSWGQGISRE
jgi:hypothetical protein